MLRRSLCAVVVLFTLGGFVVAEMFRGQVTDVEKKDDKLVSFKIKYKKKGDKEALTKTIKVNDKTKYVKVKGKDDTEDGTSADVKKGVRVFGEETNGVATEVKIFRGKKGKGKGKDKDK
jgi:hypothetical protein